MKNTMIKSVLLIGAFGASLLCAGIPESLTKSNVQDKIQAIPYEDRDILERFFRDLLFFHEFAYTLFGDKPVSVEWFDSDNPRRPGIFRTSSQGYRTFEKYAHLFPSQHYLILCCEDLEEDLCEFTLINKKAFQQTFEAHKKKFAEFFGPEVSSDELLDLLVKKRSLWKTAMKDRDDLTGILLGYGKINAELFQKRSELSNKTRKIVKDRMVPSEGYLSTKEELNDLNAILQPFSREERISLRFMRLPGFVADSKHEETVQLQKKYSEQRKCITRCYTRGDILEIVFEHLW